MSKRTILKNAMSKKYCGSTYFDYLDKEELPLIYKAMEDFAKAKMNEVENSALNITDVMPRFNLNHEVIIYPNEKGFAKIKALIANIYLLSNEEAETWVNKRKTEDGGYKEQLWVIVSDLHSMFYNGQSYMATTWIYFKNEA